MTSPLVATAWTSASDTSPMRVQALKVAVHSALTVWTRLYLDPDRSGTMTGMSQGFPDPHWGKEDISGIFKPFYAVVSSPVGSRFVRLLVPLDRRVLRATKGKYTLFGPTSLPELLLTTTGRKSGQQRTSALSYLRDGDRLLVLGSNFGQQHHPDWSSNLLADSEAVVAIGGSEIPVTATLLTGAERERGLQRFLAYPMYKSYRTRTDRELRVFALSRR